MKKTDSLNLTKKLNTVRILNENIAATGATASHLIASAAALRRRADREAAARADEQRKALMNAIATSGSAGSDGLRRAIAWASS